MLLDLVSDEDGGSSESLLHMVVLINVTCVEPLSLLQCRFSRCQSTRSAGHGCPGKICEVFLFFFFFCREKTSASVTNVSLGV